MKGDWSVANEQFAVAGEQVAFDFILTQPFKKQPLDPISIADYCILELGDQAQVSEPDFNGHFRFTQTLGRLAPGAEVTAKATAYKTFGRRDVRLIPDGGLVRHPTGDDPDRRVAGDSVRLRIYQAQVELEFPQPPDELDLETARLQIRRDDGSITSIYPAVADRPGFRVDGPTDGRYRISYTPAADELNATGTTDVQFVVYDRTGQRHELSATIETP